MIKHTDSSTLPEHKSPDDNHRTIAPYNFVPLPDIVIPAVPSAEALPDHHTYANPNYPHSGYFKVVLTTLTPTFIRDMLTIQEFQWQEEGKYIDGQKLPETGSPDFRQLVKNKPDFFTIQTNPVLPGSSLRGMLRQLVEIVSYSKLKWVTDKNLFYRTMDDTVVGENYRDRMMGKVESGFLYRDGDGYKIQICQMARIHRSKLDDQLYEGTVPMQTPRWHGRNYQHMPVWVKLSESRAFVNELKLQKQIGHEWHEGRLVITGNMPGKRDGTGGKKKEFVFLLPQKGAIEIPVPEKLLERFQDDDQITQWQQKAFPANRPHNNSRVRNGLLMISPGDFEEPVFFLRENNELAFFGRAQMFRLPYQNRPLDLIPEKLREPSEIDFAEAMFGFVRTREELDKLKANKVEPEQGSKGNAYASRVSVTNAYYNEGQGSPWLEDVPDGIVEPPILASPKPTALQNYLIQQTPNNKKLLQHYDSTDTTLRGFKLYWAQGHKTADNLRAKSPDEDPNVAEQARDMFEKDTNGRWRVKSTSTQHTRMKPVADGKSFTFRIYFENLSDVELGMLQWILTVPQCHRLGMGKPLGMGVVQLNAELYLTLRTTRYTDLFADWDNELLRSDQDFTADFEEHMVETLAPARQFRQIDRINMLLKMLEWNESDSQSANKQYVNDFKIYRQRWVLPNPPDIGPLSSLNSSQTLGQGPSGRARNSEWQENRPGRRRQYTKPVPNTRSAPRTRSTTVEPQSTVPRVGERVRGTVYTIEPNGDVYLKPEKEAYQQWLLRITHNRQEGILYQEGQVRACIVLKLLPEDEILECKPAPKKDKRG